MASRPKHEQSNALPPSASAEKTLWRASASSVPNLRRAEAGDPLTEHEIYWRPNPPPNTLRIVASSPPNPDHEPGRRRPAHWPPYENGNQSKLVFLTVNANKRKPILANAKSVAVILQAWAEADAWLVGRYAIMPDHIHLFCAPNRSEVDIERWVKYWKALASFQWPNRDEQPVWQLNCWDTQLRRGDSYATKWEYVRNNPVRHNLVADADDWPWAGEIHRLEWHEP